MNKLFLSVRKIFHNNQGQTLIEFLFLFVIMITLSFGILTNFNSRILNRWSTMVKVITSPSDTNSF